MKTWTLGVCMLLIFAILSQTGRLALEIVLSVVFVTAFSLTLMREVFERTQGAEGRAPQEDHDETNSEEKGTEEPSDEMPLAA